MERDSEAAELGELRRRAYGPGGGLDTNDAQRLEQLEAVARVHGNSRRLSTPDDHLDGVQREHVVDDPFAGMWSEPPSVMPTEAIVTGDRAFVDGEASRSGRRHRRSLLAVGAAALVGGLVIGGIATALYAAATEPLAVTVLQRAEAPIDGGEPIWFLARQGEIAYFESYRDLTVLTTHQPDQHPCLVVGIRDAEQNVASVLGFGCGSEGWRASAVVNPTMWGPGDPFELGLAPDEALRFELVGDVVEVYTAGIGTG